MGMAEITKARQEQVRRLADGSRSAVEIARRIGCTGNTVRKDVIALQERGVGASIAKPKAAKVHPHTISKIRRLAAEGNHTRLEIAELCGVSHVTVDKYKKLVDLKQQKLPDLPSQDFTYEVVTERSITRHSAHSKERAKTFALALTAGCEIVSEGWV